MVTDVKDELWSVNADGGGARRLTSGNHDRDPRWSPDGARIAFARNDDIYVINADGTGLTNLTASKAEADSEAQWTNDGKNLLYLSDAMAEIDGKRMETGARVMSRDVQTGKVRMVLDSGYNVEDIVMTPERNDLMYLRASAVDAKGEILDDDEYNPAILALNLTTGERRTVFKLNKITVGDRTLQDVVRGPDFFVIRADNTDFSDDDVALVRGGAVTFLPNLRRVEDLSPGGRQVLLSGISGELNKWCIQVYDIEARRIVAEIKTGITVPAELEANNHLIKGKQLASTAKYLAAIVEFSESIRLQPALLDALYQRGLSYGQAGEPTSAIADFSAAIKLNSVHAESFLHRAALYQNLGEDEKARNDYGSAAIFFRRPSKKAFAYRKYAELLRKAGLGAMADDAEKDAAKYDTKKDD